MKKLISVLMAALMLLLACGLCNGLVDFSQKWFTHAFPTGDAAAFSFYTYVFAALTLGALLLLGPPRTPNADRTAQPHPTQPCKVK